MTEQADLADISRVIRDYLMSETDLARTSFHATAITNLLAPLIGRP